jgi:hypothetical protein
LHFVRGTLWKRLATGRGFSRQEVVYLSYFALSLLSVVGVIGFDVWLIVTAKHA